MKISKTPICIITSILIFVALDYTYARINHHKLVTQIRSEYKNFSENEISFYEQYIVPPFKYFIKRGHFKNMNMETLFDDKKDIVIDNTKSSIIIFGCSFAHGAFLQEKDKFSYKLSEKTKRMTCNRAISSMGISQMLYLTTMKEFYKSISIQPAYAIYIYIPDHLMRTCRTKYAISGKCLDNFYLSYKLKKDKLIQTTTIMNYLNYFHIFYDFSEKILCKQEIYAPDDNRNFDFIKAHFVQARSNLQKAYPNLKYVILKYPYNYDETYNYDKTEYEYANMSTYASERWKELEELGFIILDVKTLTGIDVNNPKYQLPDGHPNGDAWEEITPKVIEALNL